LIIRRKYARFGLAACVMSTAVSCSFGSTQKYVPALRKTG
jgi:hypothetical protein